MQCREPHSRAQVPSGPTPRLPTTADGDAVWDLVARCRDALNVAGIHQWDALYPARSMIDADLQAGRVIGLSAGTRWLAVVSVWSEPEPEYAAVPWMTSGPARIVHRLCVDPALWRSGYANVLMDIVERRAAEEGAASIRLDAYSENPAALTLYRRRGYREAGRVWFPRRRAPFVCLEKDLSTRVRGVTGQHA